jgi:hypothetical protein
MGVSQADPIAAEIAKIQISVSIIFFLRAPLRNQRFSILTAVLFSNH